MDDTYRAVTGVMADINELFVDSVVHFGGDEVDVSCWNQRPSIQKFIDDHNISDLQVYYR